MAMNSPSSGIDVRFIDLSRALDRRHDGRLRVQVKISWTTWP